MEFKEYKLSELGEIVGGSTPSTKDEENYGGNISWITPKDLTNLKGRYINKGERNITEKGFKEASTKMLPQNSVLFSSRAPIGYIAINNKNEVCTNQGFKSIVPNEKIDYMFLYYLLKYNKGNIEQLGSGTTFKEVSGSVMKNIKVKIPEDKVEQIKIATILSKIDDKIELNNQINHNLHELVKNIYKKWFENEEILNNGTFDKLGNHIDIERGLSYKGKFLADEGTPMVNLGNVMPDGVFRLEKNKYYTGDYKEKVTANVGDIVIANTDMTQDRVVIGTPVIIPPIYDGSVIFSHHIYGVKNLKLPKMYVFYSLLSNRYNNIVAGSATGTTVLALPKEVILNYEILIPNKEKVEQFEKLASTIQKRREQIILENIQLEQLRDTLLPKLMNGKIDLDKIEI